ARRLGGAGRPALGPAPRGGPGGRDEPGEWPARCPSSPRPGPSRPTPWRDPAAAGVLASIRVRRRTRRSGVVGFRLFVRRRFGDRRLVRLAFFLTSLALVLALGQPRNGGQPLALLEIDQANALG